MPLRITIPEGEPYDEVSGRFIKVKETTIHIEHSLKAIRKWESRWTKPFFDQDALSGNRLMDYIRCMTIEEGIPADTYYGLSKDNLRCIEKYMGHPMTATWFSGAPKKGKGGKKTGQKLTAELVYSYMVQLGIPFECENWHINQLMTLIRVCSEGQTPASKMKMRDIYSQNAALNAARRARLHSKG